jgi:hypothetical protein
MRYRAVLWATFFLGACAEAAPDNSRDLSQQRVTDLSSFVSMDLAQSLHDLAGFDLSTVDLASTDMASAQCTHIDEPLLAPSANWQFLGSAGYDAANQRIQLTPASNHSAATAFFKTATSLPAFDLKFKYYIGNGSGSDGMAFVLAKATTVTQLGPPIDAGGTLGYQGMNGYAVELDTYQNANDPSANHVAWMDAATQTHLAVGEPAFPLDCNCERQADVRMTGTQLTITIDGTKLIDSAITYTPDTYFFGFTAATGLANDVHAVRDIHLTLGAVGPCI